MKILFLFVGSSKEAYVQQALNLYTDRLKHYVNIEIVCTPNIKGITKPEEQKQKEAAQILKNIDPSDFIILLDEKGKTPTSMELANFIENKQIAACKRMVYVICGAFGAHQDIKNRADYILSLSKFTFSHQLARIVLAEQIYRAYTILHNHPYHNEG